MNFRQICGKGTPWNMKHLSGMIWNGLMGKHWISMRYVLYWVALAHIAAAGRTILGKTVSTVSIKNTLGELSIAANGIAQWCHSNDICGFCVVNLYCWMLRPVTHGPMLLGVCLVLDRNWQCRPSSCFVLKNNFRFYLFISIDTLQTMSLAEMFSEQQHFCKELMSLLGWKERI